MSKEDILTLRGNVQECLPNALFKVYIQEMDKTIIGSISGKIRRNNIKIMTGDDVDVEITPYDLEKGRIVYRYK
tara:strand:- start:2211 stop:2432 length:222 start_codon:yes stop_codon:yes gene_type:complete